MDVRSRSQHQTVKSKSLTRRVSHAASLEREAIIQAKLVCPCSGSCPRCKAIIQRSTAVSLPSDKYELEADRIAERVVGSHIPENHTGLNEMPLKIMQVREKMSRLVQRQLVEEEEEEESETVDRLDEEEEVLQAKLDKRTTPSIPSYSGSRIGAAKEGGQPLKESARELFESRLGCSLNHVRVHTNPRAEEAAKSIKARAFTTGHDIVFGPGQYAPETREGQLLLAHELIHVVQQGAADQKHSAASDSAKSHSKVSIIPPDSVPRFQASFISFALKMGAKQASKGMLKNFIKTKIKSKLKKILNKKLVKQFAKEADEVMSILEDPWWVTAIGFIPIAGDAFDLVNTPRQIAAAIRRADKLQDKVDNALKVQRARGIARGTKAVTASGRRVVKLTSKEAGELAKRLGFRKTRNISHGQPVFRKGNRYISPDVDSHSGATWKLLNRSLERIDDLDEHLKSIH